MKRSIVGGPLLEDDLGPPLLVTTAAGRRFLILPNRQSLQCLDYETGARVAELVLEQPDHEDEDADTVHICCVTLNHHDPTVASEIWVGCDNGTIQRFAIADLLKVNASVVATLHPVGRVQLTTGSSIKFAVTHMSLLRINSNNNSNSNSNRNNAGESFLYAVLVKESSPSSSSSSSKKKKKQDKPEKRKGRRVNLIRVAVDATQEDLSDRVELLDSYRYDDDLNDRAPMYLQAVNTNSMTAVVSVDPSRLRIFYDDPAMVTTIMEEETLAAKEEEVAESRQVAENEDNEDAEDDNDQEEEEEDDKDSEDDDKKKKKSKSNKKDKEKEQQPSFYNRKRKLHCADLEDLLVYESLLSICRVLPNGTDLVVGDREGAIHILQNAVNLSLDYCRSPHYQKPSKRTYHHNNNNNNNHYHRKHNCNNPHHPTATLVTRRLHWHAHPVQALALDAGGRMLYSGGDESVLVAWQLQRGGRQPAHLLPRTALAGIQHLVFVPGASSALKRGDGSDCVVAFTGDNCLQRFDTVHNMRRVWKIQGLAARGCPLLSGNVPRLFAASNSNNSNHQVLVSGLAGAPGYLHAFDVAQQRCVQALEVAPFNRVSRTRRGETAPMPAPTITHAAFAQKHNVLLTVDVVPTENTALGAPLVSEHSAVTTLRFWERKNSSSLDDFRMVAALAHPHGSRHRVSGLAVSSNGMAAVTVSYDEPAFRLWQRSDNSGGSWTCRCKVTVPSGYANCCKNATAAGSYMASFSSDASVLAIAFGHHITLWDHAEVTLLTSLWHEHDVKDNAVVVIDKVKFLNSLHVVDMLMTQSSTTVTLQSPYGSTGPPGWNWVVPKSHQQTLHISQVEFLPSHELVAIALYHKTKDQSRVILVDAKTGSVCRSLARGETPFLDGISGKAVALSALSDRISSGRRVGSPIVLTLCVLTSNGEMVSFTNKGDDKKAAARVVLESSASPDVPTLPLLATTTEHGKYSRKRKLASVLQVSDLEVMTAPNRGFSLDHFGKTDDEDATKIVPTSELPLLRGSFARSFVARHLQRQHGE